MFKATNYILAVVDWIENTLIPGFFNSILDYEFIMKSVPLSFSNFKLLLYYKTAKAYTSLVAVEK